MYALAALILFMSTFSVASFAEAAAGINRQVNFQGKVVNTDGTNVANGSYTFLFCLYTTGSPVTACTSGADNDAVWRESKSVTVTDGFFRQPLVTRRLSRDRSILIPTTSTSASISTATAR